MSLALKQDSDNKTERIQIRLTPEEREKIEKQAKEHGMSMSQYIRWRLLFDKR